MVGELLRVRATALVVAILAVFVAVPTAQTGTRQGTGDRWEPDRLRRAIEEHYRVAPLQDGVALVPRRERGDVKSIEVTGDNVAINGTSVTGAELRERVGADSDAILALSYLSPTERRALFEPGQAGRNAPSPAQAAPAGGQAAAAPPPEPETPPRREHRTSQSDARVHIGGSVRVAENEAVNGPVVAIGGSADVDGEVSEDVVAVLGNVRLGPRARVMGDVTAVGGTVQRDPQAEVEGRVNEISIGHFPRVQVGRFWFPHAEFLAGARLMATVFRMMLFGMLAILVLLVARGPVERIEQTAAAEPWKAGLVGLLTEVFFIPFFVLTIVILAVSIIGIPLLLFLPPLAILALVAAFVVGFTGVALRIGRWAERRFGWSVQSPFGLLIVGLVAIWAFTIVGRIVSLGGWPIWFVSAALVLVGFLLEYVAWTVGLGAAVMTRLGTRPAGGAGPTAPPAPPTVAGPPVAGPTVGGPAVG